LLAFGVISIVFLAGMPSITAGKRPALGSGCNSSPAGMALFLPRGFLPDQFNLITYLFTVGQWDRLAASPPSHRFSPIAAENNPFGKGRSYLHAHEVDPADSPPMVHLDGSPPNAAIFF